METVNSVAVILLVALGAVMSGLQMGMGVDVPVAFWGIEGAALTYFGVPGLSSTVKTTIKKGAAKLADK